MDKHAFFASLYASASDDEALEAEVPSPCCLTRSVRELKQVRAPQTRSLLKSGPSDASVRNQAKPSGVTLPVARAKHKQLSPKAPFYCMDNSTAKRPKRRVPLSSSKFSSLNLFSPHTTSHSKPSFVQPAMPPLRNAPKGTKRVPKDGTESRATQSRPKKKSKGLVELPDHKKIFRGLSFYYFPNSDVSPARKFRITKAAERGAERVLNFGSGVTHIIVDSGRTYTQLLEHLKLPGVPNTVQVVNDYFAAECIEFGFLLDPSQRRFRIDGLPPSPATPQVPEKATEELAAIAEEQPEGTLQVDTEAEIRQQEIASKLSEEARGDGVPPPLGKQEVQGASDRDRPTTLEEAIQDVRRISQLPIDELSEDSDPSEPQPAEASLAVPNCDAAAKPTTKAWQNTFQCMHAHDSRLNAENPNAQTIEVLQQMIEYYERNDDQWRCMSYRKAVGALRKAAKRIETKEEALLIRGIGERLALKIEEIAQTTRLRRLEHAQAEPETQALKLFTGIYGAGTKQARAWISQGYRTLDDLLTNTTLTPTQRVGIAHHGDFAARIPREEVRQHGIVVQTALAALDTRARAVIGGSYRRGAATSGDVDFLIIGSDDMSRDELHHLIFDRLVPVLFAADYLQCALASSSPSSSNGQPPSSPPLSPASTGSKWHGAARVPGSDGGPWRRVDLLLVPAAEQGAALLYFTGNDLFNRSMRLLARKRGMRLNQRGLWQRADGKGDQKAGTLLHARYEQRIFELLDVPWREASERNC